MAVSIQLHIFALSNSLQGSYVALELASMGHNYKNVFHNGDTVKD